MLMAFWILFVIVFSFVEGSNRFGFFTKAPAFTPPSNLFETLPPDFQPRISIRGDSFFLYEPDF